MICYYRNSRINDEEVHVFDVVCSSSSKSNLCRNGMFNDLT